MNHILFFNKGTSASNFGGSETYLSDAPTRIFVLLWNPCLVFMMSDSLFQFMLSFVTISCLLFTLVIYGLVSLPTFCQFSYVCDCVPCPNVSSPSLSKMPISCVVHHCFRSCLPHSGSSSTLSCCPMFFWFRSISYCFSPSDLDTSAWLFLTTLNHLHACTHLLASCQSDLWVLFVLVCQYHCIELATVQSRGRRQKQSWGRTKLFIIPTY